MKTGLTNVLKASQFPGDESFSRDPKAVNLYITLENKKPCVAIHLSGAIMLVEAPILSSENCSEVQALIASRLGYQMSLMR